MSTILERLKSGRINKSREFRFVLKTKNTPLFPLTSNDPSYCYIDILINPDMRGGKWEGVRIKKVEQYGKSKARAKVQGWRQG